MSCLFEYSEVSENYEYSIFNFQFFLHPTIGTCLTHGDGYRLLSDNL